MSLKLMVRVMEEIDVTRPQQLVLLSMAENASDDGSRCFPSVDLIAWKAGYKPRAVIDIIRDLRQIGVLEVVKEHRAQRATEYRIHLDKAPRKQTFEEWQETHGRHKGVRRGAISREVQSDEGCNLTCTEVQSHVKTTRENAPEPLGTVKEPLDTSDGEDRPSKPHRDLAPDEVLVDVWASECNGGIWPIEAGTARRHAKKLVRGGFDETETRDLIAWCRELEWRTSGITLGFLASQADNYRSAKREGKATRRKANSKGGMVWG